jgi:hypothetical protein
LPIVVVAVGGLMAGVLLETGAARAGDYTKIYAEGLRHSRKAARLAGADNCAAAVPEYTAAFRLLKDPVLLFNRAECYRLLGERNAALADYRRFLSELPRAPNRARVEAHIAALDSPPPPAPAVPAVPATPGSGGAPLIGEPPAAPPAAPDARGTSLILPGSDLVPSLSPRRLAPDRSPDLTAPLDLTARPRSSDQDEERPSVAGRWWFWTALAGVAVGGGLATYFSIQAGKTEIPSSQLGNYRF